MEAQRSPVSLRMANRLLTKGAFCKAGGQIAQLRGHWARTRGVTFGGPKLRPDQWELARELVRGGKSISAVATTFNVHPATIYRIIDE